MAVRNRLAAVALAGSAYNIAASVLAWQQGWPPQFGGNPEPGQSYASFLLSGAAISAPLPALLALLAGLAVARRRDAWAHMGLAAVAVVGLLFAVAAIAEYVAEHPFVPMPAVYGLGGVNLLLGLSLLALTGLSWREQRRGQRASAQSTRLAPTQFET